MWRDIPRDNGVCPNDGVMSDPDALQHNRIDAQPAVVLDHYRLTSELVALCRPFSQYIDDMIRIRNKYPWGNQHVVLNFYRYTRIALKIMQDVAVVANPDLKVISRFFRSKVCQAPAVI
jgi:hypothetical protein